MKGKRADADAVHGTVKAAVLTNDSSSSNLIVASCYDQKPFYMISHSILQVTWVECSKPIWIHQLKKEIDFKFLRWILLDDYNYEINDNDIVDLVYCMEHFQQNEKWWWVLWIWGLEVSFTNAFMMMMRYCQAKRVENPLDHRVPFEVTEVQYVCPTKRYTQKVDLWKDLSAFQKTHKIIE